MIIIIFVKIQRLWEVLSMTQLLYLKHSAEIIWVYNILLIEKSVQQFIQELVSFCPHVTCIFGKRLSPMRSSLEGKYPSHPMTKTEHISDFFSKMNMSSQFTHHRMINSIQHLVWVFWSWLTNDLTKMTGSPSGAWWMCVALGTAHHGCSRPSDAWGQALVRSSQYTTENSLVETNYRKRTFLWDWWK